MVARRNGSFRDLRARYRVSSRRGPELLRSTSRSYSSLTLDSTPMTDLASVVRCPLLSLEWAIEVFFDYLLVTFCSSLIIPSLHPHSQIFFLSSTPNRLGNKHFAAKEFDEAIKLYSEAIAIDNKNHVYFSNRRWETDDISS